MNAIQNLMHIVLACDVIILTYISVSPKSGGNMALPIIWFYSLIIILILKFMLKNTVLQPC